MNIKDIIQSEKEGLLSIYVTSGYPEVDSLPKILPILERSGVDFVEVGFPYSDPLSDGVTIQQSSAKALQNGITVDAIFNQLETLRLNMGLVAMGYFNSVYQYGFDKFCARCKKVGISGLILPDLPLKMYRDNYQSICQKYGISMIFLITPKTSEARIMEIDQESTSFIYAVSSSSTTGKQSGIIASKEYLKRLAAMQLKHSIIVGFNISSKEDFLLATTYAKGGIIGSAFIRSISYGSIEESTQKFVQSILTSAT